MDYFGDESGHLKGVLNGDCEVFVIGVVGGDRVSCGRCPKQAVRNIKDISEAKWNDLLDKQKRRLFECFRDNDHLEFGYAAFTREQLHSVDLYHYLYQDVSFPPDWDLALTGYAYGEILYEMGAPQEQLATFTFDQIASKKQSKALEDHVNAFVSDVQMFIGKSKQVPGIQAADCLAGGIAEDLKRDTNWLDYLETDAVSCAETALIQLENDLHTYETAP